MRIFIVFVLYCECATTSLGHKTEASMQIDDIDIAPLLKAREKFEIFRKHLDSEQEKAGAIQAFEYTYELAWKTMKRLLEAQGTIVQSPRATFREAAINWFIKDPKV